MKARFQSLCQEWLQHFTENKKRVLVTPEGLRLNDREKARITKSMQKFQIGEASEGRHLQRCASILANREENKAYGDCISYLIKEENRHSAYLGNFMKAQEIPKAKATWTDEVFKVVRRLAGLELSLRILVTAEIIALVYYRCLGRATRSGELSQICGRMLEEELQHVKFQMTAIQYLNAKKSPLMAALSDIFHVFFLIGTSMVVWMEHKVVLKADCASMTHFIDETWDYLGETMDHATVALYPEHQLIQKEGVAR